MTRFSKINKSKDEIDANYKVMGGICKIRRKKSKQEILNLQTFT